MSPSFNDADDSQHGVSRTQSLPGNGFDLLSSLVSPGPATPSQPNSSAWPGSQGWEPSALPGVFTQAMQFPGQIQFAQPGFLQNAQQDYIPLGDDHNGGEDDAYGAAVSPTFGDVQTLEAQPQFVNTTQAVPAAIQPALPPNATPEKKTTSTISQAESQKKLLELRAKLLANRPRSAASHRSGTPTKNNESPGQARSGPQKKAIKRNDNGKAGQHAANAASWSEVQTNEPGMNAEIESLLAEGRNAANGNHQIQQEPRRIPNVEEPKTTAQGPVITTPLKIVGEAKAEISDTNTSSDEEGEIRGEPIPITSVDQPFRSIESRQDTTTEAQEKIDRQLETKSAYGNLKKEKSKATNTFPQWSKEAPAMSEGSKVKKPVSPKIKRDHSSAAQGKATAYDSYKPGRSDTRRENDLERRAPSSTFQSQQETIRRLRDLLAIKDQEIEDLRRGREAILQQQASQGLTENIAQFENSVREVTGTMPVNDSDLADWLEMTEYSDEEYRQRRLSRFRKKKELDAARAELEREDQMDLEERTHRAQTTVSPPNYSFSPKVLRRASIATIAKPSKMPPPPLPLPLRESNGGDRVASDLAPLSQASTPTLKRQHAELDTDAQPAEKFVRTSNNGSRTRGSSPANSSGFQGEALSARLPPRVLPAAPPLLEDRMTRRGSDFEHRNLPRRRSPSPGYIYRRPDSRERRRSYSPRPRFREDALSPFLPPERLYQKPCFKCSKPDHQQKDCPIARRDSRDEKPAGYREAPGGFPVSQNYKGKNPRPFNEVKNGGHTTTDKLTY